MNRQEKIETVLEKIMELKDEGFFEKNLKGRSGLRSKVPTDGHPLLRFVHRMILFYSGKNPCIPTGTEFFLQNFVDELFPENRTEQKGDRLTVYLSLDGVEKIYGLLDAIASEMCVHFSLDPNGAKRRWNKAFYG